MLLATTALYAALLGVLQLVLSMLVGRERLRADVSLGDGGDPALLEAIRRHGNFLEQVPFTLLLIALLELNGTSAGWIHGLGGSLLVARLAHPWGLDHTQSRMPARFVGAAGTMLIQIVAIVMLLLQVLGG